MDRIETTKLNRNLGEVLERVKGGEQIIPTRYGKDVALLGPLSNVKQTPRDALLSAIRENR